MVDFADQPPLAFERAGHLALRLLDPVDRAGEGVAQLLDFGRRAELARQVERPFARLVGE